MSSLENGPAKPQCLIVLHSKACEVLRKAGFELRGMSSRTEAMYFGWPGNDAVIRVAYHKYKTGAYGFSGHIAAKITFSDDKNKSLPMTMRISDGTLRNLIAMRIGEYFINSGGAK